MTNEIKQFAQNGTTGAGDVLTLAAYDSDAQRLTGNQAGIARRELVNTVLRQTAHMSTGIAQFIANRYSPGVLDDGDLDAIESGMVAAVLASVSGQFAKLDEVQQWLVQQYFNTATLTIDDDGNIAVDLDTDQIAEITLTQNATLSAPTNMQDGARYVTRVIQDGTGAHTLAFDVAYQNAIDGTSLKEVASAAGAVTVYVWDCDGTVMRDFSNSGDSNLGYIFNDIPTTEATADINTFVCEFTEASGNETGTGGGLSGADLVLTQLGTVGAFNGFGRTITKGTAAGFSTTLGFVNALFGCADGFTTVFHIKNLDYDNSNTNLTTMITNAVSIVFNSSPIGFELNAGATGAWVTGRCPINNTVAAGDVYIFLSASSTTNCSFFGVSTMSNPKSFADFVVYDIKIVDNVENVTASTSFSGGLNTIVGAPTATAPGFEIASISVSKNALVTT